MRLGILSQPRWKWQRWRCLSAVLVAASISVGTLLSFAPGVDAAWSGGVWSNVTAFSPQCGITGDSAPATLASMAYANLSSLGYTMSTSKVGSTFTRSEFLADFVPKYAVYVHSHGDLYWGSGYGYSIDSGFREDAGVCANGAIVRASDIRAHAGPPYYFVVMSTCMLGTDGIANNQIPDAFGFAHNSSGLYTKSSTGRQFYLGYTVHASDSDAVAFEQAFWNYLTERVNATVSRAFSSALLHAGSSSPNWFGNPNWNGRPG